MRGEDQKGVKPAAKPTHNVFLCIQLHALFSPSLSLCPSLSDTNTLPPPPTTTTQQQKRNLPDKNTHNAPLIQAISPSSHLSEIQNKNTNKREKENYKTYSFYWLNDTHSNASSFCCCCKATHIAVQPKHLRLRLYSVLQAIRIRMYVTFLRINVYLLRAY